MRIVLDTNVLISGVFFGGVPGQILTAWAEAQISLVLSLDILEEYRRVGAALRARDPELAATLEPILALLPMNALIVNAPPLPVPVCDDAADDMFLAAATASRTNMIVSGDKHLLRASGWRGITVLKPRQFVDAHLRSG